jgi:hypothetical protein
MVQVYSENSLVEQPAIQLFAEMGWQTLSAVKELFGVGGGQSMDQTVHVFHRQTPYPRHICDLLFLRLLLRKIAV